MKTTIILIVIIIFNTSFFAQKLIQLKLYTLTSDEYWVDAAHQDSTFLYRNYFLKYKVINKSKDTIVFNTLHYSTSAAFTENDEIKFYAFGFFKLIIEDKGWNKESSYCNKSLKYDEYKKLDNKLLLSFIVKIPPNDSLDDNIKSFCCPQCDVLNNVVFRKDYKLDEKYIKAQLFYDSKKKLYNYPKGRKYWKGKLESNIIYF